MIVENNHCIISRAQRDLIPEAERHRARTAKESAAGRKGNAAKQEDVESNVRQAAIWYKHLSGEHPRWNADRIKHEICERLDVSARTLDTYLAKARKQGLIPPRHKAG